MQPDRSAFFYSTRFFDKPGDAARGKQVFAAKHCGECHGITQSRAEAAPPVVKWESLGSLSSWSSRCGITAAACATLLRGMTSRGSSLRLRS